MPTDLFGMSLQALERRYAPGPDYRTDPVLWINDKLGEFLWSKQREICASVVANRYTAVHSAHDQGKSYLASRVAAWFMSVHEPGSAFLVSTAPTSAQVASILWREIGRAHQRAKLRGRIVTAGYPQWKLDNGELIGYGRKPALDRQTGGGTAFQGIHAEHVLVIVDESCGIPRELWDAIDALATNDNARVLAIGNPDDPNSHFARICRPGSGWNTIRIDGLQSPNINSAACERYPQLAQLLQEEGLSPNDEVIPDSLRPLLMGAAWLTERIDRWGVDSALWVAKVRGLFPDSSNEGIIPLSWVERAIDRWREWDANGRPVPRGRAIVACDVARFGDDQSCVGTRIGHVLSDVQRIAKADTMSLAETVDRRVRQIPGAAAAVDVNGIGAGVVDRLRQLNRKVWAFNASKSTTRRDITGEYGFMNTRSAAFWNLREMLDPANRKGPMGRRAAGEEEICLPDDDQLREDLTCVRWVPPKNGDKIRVEPKEDIKARLGRSPDVGDMAAIAFWIRGSLGDTTQTPLDPHAAAQLERIERAQRERERRAVRTDENRFFHDNSVDDYGERLDNWASDTGRWDAGWS